MSDAIATGPDCACVGCKNPVCCSAMCLVSSFEIQCIIHLHRFALELNRSKLDKQLHLEIDGMTNGTRILKDSQCAFLLGNRCSIYNLRPMTCTLFTAIGKRCPDSVSQIKIVDFSKWFESSMAVQRIRAKSVSIPFGYYYGIAIGIMSELSGNRQTMIRSPK